MDLDFIEFVKHDARYDRPAEVDLLLGDATKAKNELGWEPKVDSKQLVNMMVDSDLKIAQKELTLKEAGLSAGGNEPG